MNKPNFILVGAPKAGTTSISNYLNEHPDIFISKEKEPFYFLPNILKKTNKNDPMYGAIAKKAHLNPEDYYGLFNDVSLESKIGEATVHYLFHYKEVIPRILEELGDVQIIITLRNPSLRAFSNYKYQSKGQISSFEKALKLEENRKLLNYNSFWYYKAVGNYFEPVQAYLESFTNVHICFFEDFKEQPLDFMRIIFEFLKVNSSFIPNLKIKHNPTIVPKNKLIHLVYYIKHKYRIKLYIPSRLKVLLKKNSFRVNNDKINSETYKKLQNYYKPNIIKLENLINKDLSHWYL